MSYLYRTGNGRNNVSWSTTANSTTRYLRRTSSGRNNVTWTTIPQGSTYNILQRNGTGKNNVLWANLSIVNANLQKFVTLFDALRILYPAEMCETGRNGHFEGTSRRTDVRYISGNTLTRSISGNDITFYFTSEGEEHNSDYPYFWYITSGYRSLRRNSLTTTAELNAFDTAYNIINVPNMSTVSQFLTFNGAIVWASWWDGSDSGTGNVNNAAGYIRIYGYRGTSSSTQVLYFGSIRIMRSSDNMNCFCSSFDRSRKELIFRFS